MDLSFYTGSRPYREIRAVYDDTTVRLYLALPRSMAEPGLEAQRLVPPYRTTGLTSWVKPSFLWAMARTGWGRYCRLGHHGTPEHDGDTIVLGLDVRRACFDDILAKAHVTHREESPELDSALWRQHTRAASVLVQWDPEKDIEGQKRPWKAIQIGLRAPVLGEFASSGIVGIADQASVIAAVEAAASASERVMHLPDERPYPVTPALRAALHMELTVTRVEAQE